ncbi:MAG TPA: histidine kinase [bacterium]|jgi:signal transduction histidine kinase|nr:histidine kinase [bacterium]
MNRLGRAGQQTLAVVAILVALGAAYLWRQISGPSDGAWIIPSREAWTVDGVAVSPLVSRPGGLREGDVVIAVDGLPLEAVAGTLWQPWRVRTRWTSGQGVIYTVQRDGLRTTVPVTLGAYPLRAVLTRVWGTILFAGASLAIAAFVFVRRPDLLAARVLFLWAAAITSATTWSFGLGVRDLVEVTGFWLYKLTTFGAYMVFAVAGVHFALIFPQPKLALSRARWIIPALYAAPFAVTTLYLAATWPGAGSALLVIAECMRIESVLATAYLALLVGAIIWSYRVTRDPVGRQQVRWVVLGGVIAGVGGLLLWQLPSVLVGRPLIDTNAIGLLTLLFPIALAVAILQYRLFDIDVITNRALVYGALTASIVGIYVAIVGYIGALFEVRGNPVLSLAAAAAVALLAQPLRERLQRAVNRWMYGERDDPYTVLSALSRRLEAVVAPEAVLPAIVETVAQTLKLPYAAVALRRGASMDTVAACGLPRGTPVVMPLAYQGLSIGEVVLSPRGAGEPFAPAEQRLLEDIAKQIGAAAHAVLLTEDLQRSRERLVTTREEERRRLRRDLHDGLGPALAGITLKLDAARNLLAQHPQQADAMLADLKVQMQAAIADIRRLVYELRPPALDELGLIPALREQIGSLQANGLRISMAAPDRLPPLPAAIEVAAYRITQEALTNVVRHARARECRVSISIDDAVQVEVVDDGVGVSKDNRAGVGLTSMRERAAELGGTYRIEPAAGGGTRIVARLPLEKS